MVDELSAFLAGRAACTERPLSGLTVLVVEDSRFASEAMRLLCLRSGARIRRADCLRSAHRHLQTYRPMVVIVDLGLPDGSGAKLIADLVAEPARRTVVLGTSGDAAAEAEARAAGADGFLAKPVESLAAFQQLILAALPPGLRPVGLHTLTDTIISPDPLALRDDLARAAAMLADAPDADAIAYITHFLGGIARSAHDPALESAAVALAQAGQKGIPTRARIADVAGVLRARLTASAAI
ncbi:two-component system response regulator [Phaeovulum sp.]|uniref:response regulator n=1 Tax=Phaeovulum sp. TaxID=2934796 RepID=UPI003567853A